MATKTTTKKRTTKKTEVKQTWKVKEVPTAGGIMYTAYKLKDEAKPDEDGNHVTYGGIWTYKAEAEKLAKALNEEGKK